MLQRLLLPVTDVVKLAISVPTAPTEEKERGMAVVVEMVVEKEVVEVFLEVVDNNAIGEIKVEEEEVDKKVEKVISTRGLVIFVTRRVTFPTPARMQKNFNKFSQKETIRTQVVTYRNDAKSMKMTNTA